MIYFVQYRTRKSMWKGLASFITLEEAREFAGRRLKANPTIGYRVFADGSVLWSSISPETYFKDLLVSTIEETRIEITWVEDELHPYPQEDTSMGDNPIQPLTIPRDALITRLQERATEEEAARTAAQAKIDEARTKVLGLANQLTDDQVVNLVIHYVSGNAEDFLTDVVENDKYVSQDLQPTSVETTLEKQIRVLGLANNDTIEVRLGDPLYPYL